MTLHVKLVTGPPSWYSEVTTAVRLQSWSYIYTGKQRHSLYHGSVAWLKPCAHQQQCQSNSVKCYKSNDSFDKVETNWTCRPTICFDFVERTKFYDKLVRHCCRFWQQSRTLLRHCRWCGRGLKTSPCDATGARAWYFRRSTAITRRVFSQHTTSSTCRYSTCIRQTKCQRWRPSGVEWVQDGGVKWRRWLRAVENGFDIWIAAADAGRGGVGVQLDRADYQVFKMLSSCVRPSVCHKPVLYQYGQTWDHANY